MINIDIGQYHSFFFDFDGVIVDSINIKTEAFAQLYRPFGPKIEAKVVSHHLSHGGLSRFKKFSYYHKNYLGKDLSESEMMSLAKRFSELVVSKVIKAPLITGALEFLQWLKNQKKNMFIVSGTVETEIKEILKAKKLDKYFTETKGSPATKKANLSYLLNKYRPKIFQCLYFGDAQEDLDAAGHFKLRFIPVNFHNMVHKGYLDFADFMKLEKINI